MRREIAEQMQDAEIGRAQRAARDWLKIHPQAQTPVSIFAPRLKSSARYCVARLVACSAILVFFGFAARRVVKWIFVAIAADAGDRGAALRQCTEAAIGAHGSVVT